MDHAQHIGEDAIFNVKTIAKKLVDEKNQEAKDKLYKRFTTLRHDIDMSIKEQNFVEICSRAGMAMADWEKVKRYVDRIYKATPEELEDADLYLNFIDQLSAYSIYLDDIPWGERRFFNQNGCITDIHENNFLDYQVEAGDNIVKAIAHAVGTKRKFNMLLFNAEFYVHSGIDIKAEFGDNVNLYGIYETDMYNQYLMNLDTRKIFSKVAIGGPDKSVVKNRSVDYCVYRFRYNQNSYDNEVAEDLIRIARYMRPGGIVAAYMPPALLYSKVCTALAKVYDYVGSQYLPTKNYGHDIDMAMMVFRATDHKSEEEVDKTFQQLMGYDPGDKAIDLEKDMPDIISGLPEKEAPAINLFLGEREDWAVVEIVFDESPLHNDIETKEVDKTLRPLLPLKKGQIGQALASGRLDGIIDEGNGIKHLIKGRVYHGTHTTSELDTSDPQNAVRTTKRLENNLIDIKLIAGDGTIKELTLAG